VTFTHFGVEDEYFDDPYNNTRKNERAVEIPIAKAFVGPGDGLEVGNVLGHYGVTGHRVVDKYEQAEGVESLDVFDIQGSYDWIIAISTLEHVRWDPPEKRRPQGSFQAMGHLRSLLNAGGRMLVTIPFGHQPYLDASILDGASGATRECSFVRRGDGWVQTPQVHWEPYGKTTIWAESVWIGEFL
jgi:hypothetical protein